MLTLILSTQNLTTFYQNAIGWVAVAVDVITAIVMLVKVLKAKKITLSMLLNLLRTQKGRKQISEELGRIIAELERAEKADEPNPAEDTEQKDKKE